MTAGTSRRGPSGAALIVGATVVAGIAGYLVTFLVYRATGPAQYALFAIFWATLYLVVGGLSGIQQEITRATHPVEPVSPGRASRARTFGLAAALVVGMLVVASAVLWQGPVFGPQGWSLVWPLAVGAGSYVLVATLCGSLYGVSHWRSLALMIGADGLLRLLLLGGALVLSRDIVVLAWAVALPFPLAIVILWPVIRRGFVGRSALDVGYREVSWNVGRTVMASISTAVLVSGFPLLLGIGGTGVDPAFLGELIFTIILTRAPLIVTIQSLQSFLVVRFRDSPSTWKATFLRVQGAILLGVATLGALGWVFGPVVFAAVTGRTSTIDGSLIAVLVVSSGLVGSLSVSASAVLAANRHSVYLAGWVAAAIVTIVLVLLPGEFVANVSAALLLGPLAGLVVHAGWLVATHSRTPH